MPVFEVIAERDHTAHPHAFSLGGGNLVPDSLSRHFPLKLGKGEKNIQRQPSHRCGGVELLGDGDKADALFVELLDDLGKVCQRACQPVDLIDDNGIDSFGCDVFEQSFQGWSFHVAAGEAAIVILSRNQLPAFMSLADDIGFAGFPLGIERIEGLLQTFFRRFASIDGAADPGRSGHAFFLVPKKAGPTTGFR